MNVHMMARCQPWVLFLSVPSTLIFETSYLTCLELINSVRQGGPGAPVSASAILGLQACDTLPFFGGGG